MRSLDVSVVSPERGVWRHLALVLLLVGSLLPGVLAGPAFAADNTFDDDNTSIFEVDIEAIAAEDITRGCNPPTNDRFCPTDSVSRGEMAAFLVRALDLKPSSTDYFEDDDDSIFEADIQALRQADVTRGCNPPDNDRFCPGDEVTRGAMAAFLVRALDLKADSTDRFTDDDDSIFEADIQALAAAGITKGCNPPGNTEFCPTDSVTRGQMAAFLVRALDLPRGEDPTPYGDSPRGDNAPAIKDGTVTNIVDGDTVDLDSGTRVRLAIADTPEVHGGIEECGPEASAFTKSFIDGEYVTIYRPEGAPKFDSYDRLLGEVVRASDGASLNVALVAAGLAEIDERFTDEDPDLTKRLRDAAANADNPNCASQGSDDGDGGDSGDDCHPSYPDNCFPYPPPDLNCGDISARNFRVVNSADGYDPHGFDGNKDGVGCES